MLVRENMACIDETIRTVLAVRRADAKSSNLSEQFRQARSAYDDARVSNRKQTQGQFCNIS